MTGSIIIVFIGLSFIALSGYINNINNELSNIKKELYDINLNIVSVKTALIMNNDLTCKEKNNGKE
jgi:hypothetical protein